MKPGGLSWHSAIPVADRHPLAPMPRRWDEGMGWELDEPGGHSVTADLRLLERQLSYRTVEPREPRERDRRLAGKDRVRARRADARRRAAIVAMGGDVR